VLDFKLRILRKESSKKAYPKTRFTDLRISGKAIIKRTRLEIA
jgi:hypothetical protein